MVRGFHYIEASGNLIGVPFENDLTIWKESNETYILNELNLPDLSQNQEVREIFKEQSRHSADFNLVSGSMKAGKTQSLKRIPQILKSQFFLPASLKLMRRI